MAEPPGLTYGVIYGRYASKEALTADALTHAFDTFNQFMANGAGSDKPSLASQLDYFLSTQHRDNLETGCPITALVGEISRGEPELSSRFAIGYSGLVAAFRRHLPPGSLKFDPDQTARTLVAALVGAVAVARATSKADSELSERILRGARSALSEL